MAGTRADEERRGVRDDRGRLLIGWAELLALKGESAAAERAFAEGLPVVRTVGDPVDLAAALISYGAALNHAGKYAEGASPLGEGLSLAETIQDHRLRAAIAGRALGNLSDSARGQGDLDLAAAYGEESRRRSRQQRLDLAENRTLMDLGHIARDQGNPRLAVERYLSCIERTGDRGEPRLVAESLAGIASAATTWGQPRAALLLFGAADALRDRVGIGMSMPIDAVQVDRDVAALRAALGEREAKAVLAEGRALPLPEAIAIAAVVTSASLPAVQPAGRGESDELTAREREILRLLVARRTDREIAEALFLSPRTVHWHVSRIFSKLGVDSRRQAAALAIADGLI